MRNPLKQLGIIGLYLILLTNCEDAEPIPKDYPFVIIKEVKIFQTSVTFVADLLSPGVESISSYGFVWNEEPLPQIEIHDFKSIGASPKTGKYRLEVSTGLVKDQTYYVRPFIKTLTDVVYGPELSFVSPGSNPPEIDDFQPKFGSIGTSVEITGNNFGISNLGNTVRFGEYQAEVDSTSETKVYVKVPSVMKPGEVNLTIETAGALTSSIEKFDLYFPWRKFENINHDFRTPTASFAIGERAYIIRKNNSSGVEFDTSNGTLQSIVLPENAGRFPMAFTISNKGYVLLESGFYEYDPLGPLWTQKADFPDNVTDRRYAFMMSFEQIGFIGFCYNNQRLWSYNPEEDTWTEKANFPENYNLTVLPVWGNFTFSIQKKGYLGVFQSSAEIITFWEYDIDIDSWTGKTPLPTDAYAAHASMVINGEGYVGLGLRFTGSTGDNKTDQIWKYDQSVDDWVSFRNCPVPMQVSASFGLGNKGYVIAGVTNNSIILNDIWEFDPQKN